MGRPAFAFAKTKAQSSCAVIRNSTADKRLYFRYIDSTIPLLPKSEILSF